MTFSHFSSLSVTTMSTTSFSFTSKVFTGVPVPNASVSVDVVNIAQLHTHIIKTLLQSASDGALGVAPVYGTHSALSKIAFASRTRVLVVIIGKPSSLKKDVKSKLAPLVTSHLTKAAFRMDSVVAAFFMDLQLLLDGGIDLLSTETKNERESMEALFGVLGSSKQPNQAKARGLFEGYEKAKRTTDRQLAEQAWIAWYIATTSQSAKVATPIRASAIPTEHLTVLAKLVRDRQQLHALKPHTTENEISPDYSVKRKQLNAQSIRFKTRLQRHNPVGISPLPDELAHIFVQQVMLTMGEKKIMGHISSTNGKKSKISYKGSITNGKIPLKITTIGKEPPTNAESKRTSVVLSALKQTNTIVAQPFFKALWLDAGTKQNRKPLQLAIAATVPNSRIAFPRQLNPSQEAAIRAILSPQPMVVIQGPPGTGKTTVIAAAVINIRALPVSRRQNVYLVAQSNVAVKNIAEKLASVDFLDFKLIVSKEFHYEWHEHLYHKVNPNLIRMDKLEKNIVGVERQLLGAKVILCTLSMLSNPNFGVITQLVPLQTVIIDEASQIEVGDYVPLISLFSTTLNKMAFIGDDKQLPPYGQSDISSLKSVFEMSHLRDHALFLDTQYRSVPCLLVERFDILSDSMPMQLGRFIGERVYNSKLKSMHPIATRCCEFIDVSGSAEERKGQSWFNLAEIKVVIAEARKLVQRDKSFRIITPYDPQRSKIEAALRSEGLDADDKVFCVDSFQGNEDDYIILSLVRTSNIGFMAEKRRVNVMLTRCKRGLTIVTNKTLVDGKAEKTLIGKLALSLGKNAWRPFE
ncbi:AAA-12 domain-containing protein [Mycena indigotica]|uniref:AAA-12 domain-containing protein n=1 Tax=Mycena indigotica TaxID=2126181 RepID=A0A8H6WBA5_9AGAR|nr:AAA-12 domain-containing protein [Mycena indigotica]KAF7312419.1 AAA-12 domain-containing protein [Mycena indigotica]